MTTRPPPYCTQPLWARVSASESAPLICPTTDINGAVGLQCSTRCCRTSAYCLSRSNRRLTGTNVRVAHLHTPTQACARLQPPAQGPSVGVCIRHGCDYGFIRRQLLSSSTSPRAPLSRAGHLAQKPHASVAVSSQEDWSPKCLRAPARAEGWPVAARVADRHGRDFAHKVLGARVLTVQSGARRVASLLSAHFSALPKRCG